jgi:RimJ/RimL family protein N-acetyltransferase
VLKPLQLLTPRLVLRPATPTDAAVLQRLCPETDIKHWCAPASSDGSGLWLIGLAGRSGDVGCVALRPSAMAPSFAAGNGTPIEPLVALWPEHRGHGYAQEALKAVLWHAQSATSGRSFVAVCDVPNTSGDRLLRRLGFVPGYEADGGRWRVRQYRLCSGGDQAIASRPSNRTALAISSTLP